MNIEQLLTSQLSGVRELSKKILDKSLPLKIYDEHAEIALFFFRVEYAEYAELSQFGILGELSNDIHINNIRQWICGGIATEKLDSTQILEKLKEFPSENPAVYNKGNKCYNIETVDQLICLFEIVIENETR